MKYEGSFIGKTTDGESVILPQPTYKIGEEVAIAQKYWDLRNCDAFYESLQKADSTFPLECIKGEKGCHNKMFVRADWMPHRIRITNIKAERLRDIGEEDCLHEGIVKTDYVAPYGFPVGNGIWKNYRTPQDAFAALIDRISGRGTWNRNPWVYAYEFELTK